jgi:hypothetical protein
MGVSFQQNKPATAQYAIAASYSSAVDAYAQKERTSLHSYTPDFYISTQNIHLYIRYIIHTYYICRFFKYKLKLNPVHNEVQNERAV